MADDYNKSPWIKMSIADLTTPQPGRMCMGPRWWAITDDGHALFFRSYDSPQCNVDQRIVEYIRPDCTPQFIEATFVPHRCDQ